MLKEKLEQLLAEKENLVNFDFKPFITEKVKVYEENLNKEVVADQTAKVKDLDFKINFLQELIAEENAKIETEPETE